MICSLELYSERFLTPRIYVMYQHLITARTLPSQSLSRPLQRTHSDAHPELIRSICRLLRVRAVSVSPGFFCGCDGLACRRRVTRRSVGARSTGASAELSELRAG